MEFNRDVQQERRKVLPACAAGYPSSEASKARVIPNKRRCSFNTYLNFQIVEYYGYKFLYRNSEYLEQNCDWYRNIEFHPSQLPSVKQKNSSVAYESGDSQMGSMFDVQRSLKEQLTSQKSGDNSNIDNIEEEGEVDLHLNNIDIPGLKMSIISSGREFQKTLTVPVDTELGCEKNLRLRTDTNSSQKQLENLFMDSNNFPLVSQTTNNDRFTLNTQRSRLYCSKSEVFSDNTLVQKQQRKSMRQQTKLMKQHLYSQQKQRSLKNSQKKNSQSPISSRLSLDPSLCKASNMDYSDSPFDVAKSYLFYFPHNNLANAIKLYNAYLARLENICNITKMSCKYSVSRRKKSVSRRRKKAGSPENVLTLDED